MALQRPALPHAIVKLAQQHQAMQQTIRASLAAELAAHVTYINLRSGTLILGCDQQSLVTTLRFCAPQLLAAVNALLPHPSALRVAWRTVSASSRPNTQALQRTLSPKTLELIATTAQSIQDPALSAAMQGLARAMRLRTSLSQ
jgi:predicted nucleic acid-binding Zn ribbon protein